MRQVAIWALRIVAGIQIALVISHWLTLFGSLWTLWQSGSSRAVPILGVVSIWPYALTAAVCLLLSEWVLRKRDPANAHAAKLS